MTPIDPDASPTLMLLIAVVVLALAVILVAAFLSRR